MSFLQNNSVVAHAPAKLNLFLKVLGKRDDGFHELETVMQTIDLYDTLEFRLRPDSKVCLTVEQTQPQFRVRAGRQTRDIIPTDQRNLVIQAALLLQKETGCSKGVDIRLIKRIPSQAGLGGGSSDAATTLNVLNQLWDLELEQSDRLRLGAELGSDIPFFVSETPFGVCRGRGEEVESYPTKKVHYLLVKPYSGLSTAQVYANCVVSKFSQSAKDFINGLHEPNFEGIKSDLFYNSLQEPARVLNSEVRTLLDILNQESLTQVMMSGSGTACFGVCRSRLQAIRLGQKFQSMNLGSVFWANSRV